LKTLRLILCDQLSLSLSSLRDVTPQDTVLMCEVMEEATYVRHHPKKIALWFAAMRHFAEELKEIGMTVRYVTLSNPSNTANLSGEVKRAVEALNAEKIIVTEPSEYRLMKIIVSWQETLGVPVEVREDNRFLCDIQAFKAWCQGKKQLRMEYFYRDMRKKYRILLEPDGSPTGGEWNYDKENRKAPPKNMTSLKRISHKKSPILQEVLTLVTEKFSDHFGDLKPFHFAITRHQALIELNDFIERILPHFGDYQDAMVKGEAYLNHSLLSSYINLGLLLPLEVCQLAERAYRDHKVPLNAAEGFIRQILGWREYVRGIYWLKMPEYSELNYLNATNHLPNFYWGAKTHMACIAEAVTHTREHAYSHHIQRLMITGNFALIAGLDVKEVQAWYLAVYSDAFEWVEMPNTLGMALFGDGGIIASKPYAASGNYIHKMSDFCKHCRYNPKEMLGDTACPFNALYWNFMARNRDKLGNNQRLSFVYTTFDKFDAAKKQAIENKALNTLSEMEEGTL
jgi:deoxyribodipyrimidine photolyase-related protein